jgi:pimeloyl-ACP methyl ester carboxylesterase
MQYLANLELVKRIASEIVQDRRCNYNEEQLIDYLESNKDAYEVKLDIKNSKKNDLFCSLFRVRDKQQNTCIVYLHGLGSNRLEVLSLLNTAGDIPYDTCSFDFSGSGKSEGYYTSYGLSESEDISSFYIIQTVLLIS